MFLSSTFPPLPDTAELITDETLSPTEAPTSASSDLFLLLKSEWSANETSAWVAKLYDLLRKNRIFVPRDLLVFKDKLMQVVFIDITGQMEFQAADHVKWNYMLSMIPPRDSAAAPLVPMHLKRETIIKPTAATAVAPAQLKFVTRAEFVTRLINFESSTVTLAPFMRDLLLIGDDLNGFDLHPQTHFSHTTAAHVDFRCVCQARYQLQMRKGGIVELAQLSRHISHDHMKLAKSPIASPSAVTKKRERETQTVLTAASFTRSSPMITARPPPMPTPTPAPAAYAAPPPAEQVNSHKIAV